MEISASATYDYCTMKKWFRHSALVRTVLLVLLAAAFIGLAVQELIRFIYAADRPITVPVVAILYFAFAAFYIYMIAIYSKRSFKRMGNLQNTHIAYIFREDGYSVTITADGINGQEEYGWHGVKKVVESGDQLYIYLQSHRAHIVDETTIRSEDLLQLRAFFTEKFGKQFISRNNRN